MNNGNIYTDVIVFSVIIYRNQVVDILYSDKINPCSINININFINILINYSIDYLKSLILGTCIKLVSNQTIYYMILYCSIYYIYDI